MLALVAFMLGQREDLRDRFIRLIGADNVTLTTRLMDEAAHRVSQFLVWQTLINLVFGTLVAAGLYWIGVPYAALWGGLTAVLRFVPYVGTILSALVAGHARVRHVSRLDARHCKRLRCSSRWTR